MTSTRRTFSRFIASFAAIALVATLAGEARADSYAYATQSLNTFAFSGLPTGSTVGSFTTQASDAALNAQGATPSGIAGDTSETDPAAAYVGNPPIPAQNLFTPVGAVNPDYSRGDSQIAAGAVSVSTVAEGLLTPPGRETGSGSYSFSRQVTLTSAGTVTLAFNYTNDLNAFLTGFVGLASASNAFNFTITTVGGTTILFSSSPSAVNNSVSLTTPSTSDITPGSGSVSITSSTLAAGTYVSSITGNSKIEVTQSIIPEPSSVVLLGSGLLLGLGTAVRRTRKARSTS